MHKFNLSCLNFVIFMCFPLNFDLIRKIVVTLFIKFIVFTMRRREKKRILIICKLR